MLKIYKITFNDGGWHSSGSRPNFKQVAENEEEAKKIVLENNPQYANGYDLWCIEFKLDGYVIEVYDEKTYKREKNIEKLGI